MDRPNRAATFSIASFAAALAIASAAAAERGPNPESPGYPEFQQYCASCHGVGGAGDGPMAPVLDPKPADLRKLSTRFGNPLPRPKLVAIIDGRQQVPSHGTSEMPVWGKRLHAANRGDQAQASHVRGTILVIIEYLQSLQVDTKQTDAKQADER